MIDSIQIAKDSILKTQTRTDSVISIPDSFPKEPGVLRSDTFRNESWVFAVVLILFLFLIYAAKKSFGWIRESVANFNRVKTRASLFSNATQSEYKSRHLLTLFSVGVISLLVYVLIRPVDSKIYSLTFALLYLSLLVFILIKNLIFNLLAYTFFEKEIAKLAKEQYYLVFSFLGISLFPFLLARIYLPDIDYQTIIYISIFIALIYPFILVIKLMQIFSGKILELFYILLYLCTLEIIPLFMLYQLYNFILSI